MDPLSLTASTITILGTAISTYKKIKHLKGLPKEFREVEERLSLVQNTLELARGQLDDHDLDEQSRVAIQPMLTCCQNYADKLSSILRKTEMAAKDNKNNDFLSCYRMSLVRLGKAYRVETLITALLKNVDVLARNQAFRTATDAQVSRLEKAIQELSQVESSVSESELEPARDVTQHITTGGVGHQYSGQAQTVYSRTGNHSGTGNQFNADTMQFGTIPSSS